MAFIGNMEMFHTPSKYNISARTIAALITAAALLFLATAVVPSAFADSTHIKIQNKNNCHQKNSDFGFQTCENVVTVFA